jgi:two-component system response regulator FixJ
MTEKQDLVLITDDDEAVRESLKFALEVEGFSVQICAGGEALLAHPDLDSAACILLDYRMPKMDGLSVLRELKARHSRIPVILMTVHATRSLRRQAAEAGARHVLEKPLFNGGLMDAIHDVLESGTMLAESTG